MVWCGLRALQLSAFCRAGADGVGRVGSGKEGQIPGAWGEMGIEESGSGTEIFGRRFPFLFFSFFLFFLLLFSLTIPLLFLFFFFFASSLKFVFLGSVVLVVGSLPVGPCVSPPAESNNQTQDRRRRRGRKQQNVVDVDDGGQIFGGWLFLVLKPLFFSFPLLARRRASSIYYTHTEISPYPALFVCRSPFGRWFFFFSSPESVIHWLWW